MDDPLLLTNAVRFLEAPDALSACCVCQSWHKILLNSDQAELWRQVCNNTHPTYTQTIADELPGVDFRALCVSWRRSLDVEDRPAEFASTLNFERDVFAVVELYRTTQVDGKPRREAVGPWTCDLVRREEYEVKLEIIPEERAVLTGQSRYCGFPLPPFFSQSHRAYWDTYDYNKTLESALRDAVGQVKVTLFRRDNMKSVCVLDQEVYEVYDETCVFLNGAESLPFDPKSAVYYMMYQQEIDVITFNGSIELLCRNGDDQRNVSTIPCIREFEVASFCFGFRGGPWYESLSGNFLNVAIEGLCWK